MFWSLWTSKSLNFPSYISFKIVLFPLLTEVSGIHDVKLYTYKELRIATEDFSEANKIGEGGFGSVHKVNCRITF